MDLWDDAGPFLYRHMPESGIAAFFTEERDMLQINEESDGYWLSNSGSQGADRYDTLAEAKASGDEQIAAAENTLDARLLAEAGLPAESWKVSYQDGLCFERQEGGLCIVANGHDTDTRQSWDLIAGDETLLSDAPDIAAVLAAMPSRD